MEVEDEIPERPKMTSIESPHLGVYPTTEHMERNSRVFPYENVKPTIALSP